MKISKETRTILENFSKISPSLLFLKGSTQRTMTNQETYFANATVEEDFPQDFGIYNLSQFLSVLSLFVDPEIEFEEDFLRIKEGSTEISYVYCSERVIKSPPRDKNIKVKNPLFTFDLTEDRIKKLVNTSRVMRLPHMAFQCEEGKITISLLDKANPKGRDGLVEHMAEDTDAKDGRAILDISSLNLLSDDYEVTVCGVLIVFKSKNKNVEYIAATMA